MILKYTFPHSLSFIYSLVQQIFIDIPVNQVPAVMCQIERVYELFIISKIRYVKSLPSLRVCYLKICPKYLAGALSKFMSPTILQSHLRKNKFPSSVFMIKDSSDPGLRF